MKRVLVTPPIYYPVTLADTKVHLCVDHSNHDPYIQALIIAATGRAEKFLKRRLVTQTWKIYLDAWPDSDSILLPFGKLQSVTHVKYTDTDGDQTTWYDSGTTTYADIDTDRELGRIQLAYGYSWPTASLHPQNPIEIQFVCGYGDHARQAITGATNVPTIILTITSHGRAANDTVLVDSVEGNTGANGIWKITVPTVHTIGLLGSTGNGTYTAATGVLTCLTVPEPVRHAIKIMISDMYENREDILVGQPSVNLRAARELLWPYRLHESATG